MSENQNRTRTQTIDQYSHYIDIAFIILSYIHDILRSGTDKLNGDMGLTGVMVNRTSSVSHLQIIYVFLCYDVYRVRLSREKKFILPRYIPQRLHIPGKILLTPSSRAIYRSHATK